MGWRGRRADRKAPIETERTAVLVGLVQGSCTLVVDGTTYRLQVEGRNLVMNSFTDASESECPRRRPSHDGAEAATRLNEPSASRDGTPRHPSSPSPSKSPGTGISPPPPRWLRCQSTPRGRLSRRRRSRRQLGMSHRPHVTTAVSSRARLHDEPRAGRGPEHAPPPHVVVPTPRTNHPAVDDRNSATSLFHRRRSQADALWCPLWVTSTPDWRQ